jgi:hypothetical protein
VETLHCVAEVDTDRFGLAKGRTDNPKYDQLVRIKEIRE